jgi:hypothetical protein
MRALQHPAVRGQAKGTFRHHHAAYFCNSDNTLRCKHAAGQDTVYSDEGLQRLVMVQRYPNAKARRKTPASKSPIFTAITLCVPLCAGRFDDGQRVNANMACAVESAALRDGRPRRDMIQLRQ